ncbi:putative Carrier domain-containing protein [Seiridium unicorne]|uniref:Carrier domain-containing protein n=1 Tax=Seiridium unicorne TaxID=138068 RepID=A0ABR2UE81_9PEZI
MEIFATVGSEVKRALLRDEYGIADDHIFNSRDLSLVKGVKRMTGGRGHCLAPFGTFIEIGLKDTLGNTRLDMHPFIKDATFSFFNLNHIERKRPDLIGTIIRGAFDLQRRGITRPVTTVITHDISDVENAFRPMQTGKHVGKISLTFNDNSIVPVIGSKVTGTLGSSCNMSTNAPCQYAISTLGYKCAAHH